jgi:hydrogenase maturation protease
MVMPDNATNDNSASQELLILGIGNILLGDEGIGVHAARLLEGKSFPPHIRVLDGGTGGFHLLSLFQQYKKLIMIDATLDGNLPGTVRLIRPKYAADFPQTLSAHDIGLRDLVNSSALLGFLPEIELITVSISGDQPLSMDLSPEIQASLVTIEIMVNELIDRQS